MLCRLGAVPPSPPYSPREGVSEEVVAQEPPPPEPAPQEPTPPPVETTPPPTDEAPKEPVSEGKVSAPLEDDLSTLDAAMMEIEASIHDMGEGEGQAPPTSTAEGPSEDLSDEESESEDEEGSIVILFIAYL